MLLTNSEDSTEFQKKNRHFQENYKLQNLSYELKQRLFQNLFLIQNFDYRSTNVKKWVSAL